MIEDIDKLLGPDWGKINGEDHPDTTIANAATKAERERCAQVAENQAIAWRCFDSLWTGLSGRLSRSRARHPRPCVLAE